MKKIMSRFGEIEYDPKKTLSFPEGLIGFEHLREFVVIPSSKEGLLFWIQSVDDAQIAFVLTDPTNFFLDYKVVPDQSECAKLGLDNPEGCLSLSVVTVHPDKKITLNLQAPILYSPDKCCGLQVILEKTKYESRTPLPVAKSEQESREATQLSR